MPLRYVPPIHTNKEGISSNSPCEDHKKNNPKTVFSTKRADAQRPRQSGRRYTSLLFKGAFVTMRNDVMYIELFSHFVRPLMITISYYKIN